MVIDPYLQILLIIITVLVAIIMALLAFMLISRLLTSLSRQKYRLKTQEWEDIYLNYLHGDLSLEKAAGLMGDEKPYWLWLFFAPYLEVLSGSDFEKTKTLCRETGLIDYYKKRLHRGGSASKAVAARVLGALRCRESVSEMINLLKSKNPFLVQAAAQGLAKSGETESFSPAARALLGNTFFTYEGATEILAGFGENICPQIAKYLEKETEKLPAVGQGQNIKSPKATPRKDSADPADLRSMLIDLLGFFKYREALPLLQRRLERADEETTVHILKAFINMGELPANLDLKPYLEHRYWVVRNFSARAWQLSGDRQALPVLEKLLADRNWWVRYNAAKALRSAGQPGLEILKQKTAGADQEAAAISSYVLSRSEV
ncbi:MAG: HEAT repeat domain-containing protein [Bacillota bacterium]